MIKKLLSALSCIPLLFSSTACMAHEPYKHDDRAIVQVVCTLKDGVGFGTADKIGPDTYVTARHVASLGNCSVDGVPITNVQLDPKHDFATFTGPKNNVGLKIDCHGYKAGKVYAARGYAEGGPDDAYLPWQATKMVVEGMTVFVGDAFPGMSGGAVIAESGRITGIVDIGNPSGSVALRDTSVCKRDSHGSYYR